MSWKIGVDGGGTKTECILVDDSGRVVARHLAPGCNPSIVGPDRARTVLREALDAVLVPSDAQGRRSEIGATLLCMAGSRSLWKEFAAGLSGFGKIVSVDDSLPVLELATGGGPGLVLHAGTGSFVAARGQASSPKAVDDAPFGEVFYAGGLGWKFGDPGSGYDLGRRAVARALLELQGWASSSGLSGLVRDHSGLVGDREIKAYYYSETTSNSQIASLAPGVLRLAGEGDPAAHEVVADSVSGLLDLALQVAKKLFPGTPSGAVRAGLSGPILTNPAVVKILNAIPSGLALKPLDGTPMDGVRRLLARS